MCEVFVVLPGGITVYRDAWMGHLGIMDDMGNLVGYDWCGLAVAVR